MKRTTVGIALLLLLLSCSKKDDYIIGYTGSLSRDITDISLGGRDGAILAIEEINNNGGINKRKLTLLVRDDRDLPEIAPVVDSELVAEGAFAIIGHLNSTMTQAGLTYINNTNTLLISPNSNSPLFLDKDDQLICMLPSGEEMVKTMLKVLEEDKGLPSLAVIYNGRNKTYTIPVAEKIKEHYEHLGGELTGMFPYSSSSKEFDYQSVAAKVHNTQPEAIALVTNAMDAAFFARNLYDLGSKAILIGGDATCNEEILEGSGTPVEGFLTVQAYSTDKSNPSYVQFREKFQKRFGYIPSYDAMFSYTALRLIEAALRKNPDETELKQSILSLGKFKGLTYDINLNKYGDNQQAYLVLQIQNGDLVPYRNQ